MPAVVPRCQGFSKLPHYDQPNETLHHADASSHRDFDLLRDAVIGKDQWGAHADGAPIGAIERVAPLNGVGNAIRERYRAALVETPVLTQIAGSSLVWADCEALERRHNLGREALVVLDVVPESGTPSYEEKRVMLRAIIPTDAVLRGNTSRSVPTAPVVLTPTVPVDSHGDALALYAKLREANRALRCDLFEGVVMKRADSAYPVQLRSLAEEFRGCVKHRFV